MKKLNICGQGVVEGIVVKADKEYVITLRKGNDEIDYIHDDHVGIDSRFFGKIPILRGMFAFIDYLYVAIKTLSHSVDYYEEDRREKKSFMENFFISMFGSKGDEILLSLITIITIVLSSIVFVVVPYNIGDYLARRNLGTGNMRLGIEITSRVVVFFAFLIFIRSKKDVRKIYQYQGAINKTLNCLENKKTLSIENVKKESIYRVSTHFNYLVYVLFCCVVAFSFIRMEDPWLEVGYRIAVTPIIASLVYEIHILTRKSNNFIVNLLNFPISLIEKFIVKKPKDDMLEVAIAAVESAFDWREYIGEEKTEENYNLFNNNTISFDSIKDLSNTMPFGNQQSLQDTRMLNEIDRLDNTMTLNDRQRLDNTMTLNNADINDTIPLNAMIMSDTMPLANMKNKYDTMPIEHDIMFGRGDMMNTMSLEVVEDDYDDYDDYDEYNDYQDNKKYDTVRFGVQYGKYDDEYVDDYADTYADDYSEDDYDDYEDNYEDNYEYSDYNSNNYNSNNYKDGYNNQYENDYQKYGANYQYDDWDDDYNNSPYNNGYMNRGYNNNDY